MHQVAGLQFHVLCLPLFHGIQVQLYYFLFRAIAAYDPGPIGCSIVIKTSGQDTGAQCCYALLKGIDPGTFHLAFHKDRIAGLVQLRAPRDMNNIAGDEPEVVCHVSLVQQGFHIHEYWFAGIGSGLKRTFPQDVSLVTIILLQAACLGNELQYGRSLIQFIMTGIYYRPEI